MAGLHFFFPTLTPSSTSRGFGQIQCLGQHCPQRLLSSSRTPWTHGGSGQSESESDKRLSPPFLLLPDSGGHKDPPGPPLWNIKNEKDISFF